MYSVDSLADVSNNIPIDSSSALQKSHAIAQLIICSVLQPIFVDPVTFLTSSRREAKLGDPMDLKKRPVDITYIPFRCTIHGLSVDTRVIKAADLLFHFCLRQPQHTYDNCLP